MEATVTTEKRNISKEHTLSMLYDFRSNLPDYIKAEGITLEDIDKATREKEDRIYKAKYFVTMNDKFMSGWGMASNKVNKLIIACDNYEQASTIEKNAKKRSEMKYINIARTKPQIKRNVYPSWKHWEDMGEIWTK